jgi:hypothetical protein
MNLIEMDFSQLNAHLHRIDERAFINMFGALREIPFHFTLNKRYNHFKNTEYFLD